jgi:ABC-2 type transport system permease protein
MKKTGTLLRAGLKSNFGLSVAYHRIFKEKKDRWILPTMAVSIAGILPIFFGLVFFIQKTFAVLQPMNQERALLALGILAGQIAILIFGIYYVVSAFYFSRDLEMLIPLPVRPYEVMLSKFSIIMVNEYLTIAVIVLPFLIAFGILSEGGAGYWVNAALVYAALPVIPLAVVSVLVVAMMRLVNISRKKDVFILIGSIALLVVAFGIQWLIHHAGNENATVSDFAQFLSSPDSLLVRIGAFFPPSIWAARAIAGGFSIEGLKNLALLLGISVFFFGAMIILGEQLFYKGLIGLAETDIRKRTLSRDELFRRVSSGRRAFAAIFIREWRMMNRTPVFLLNGILIAILLPVLFIPMVQATSSPVGAGLRRLAASDNTVPIILSVALFMVICGGINGTASSAFSREGVQFWISRVIPVAPQEQAAAKFLHSYLVGMLGIVAAAIVAGIILELRAALLLSSAGLALAACALMTAVGMIIDLSRPLLDWTNPQKAIKQNLNVLLALCANIGILTVLYFGVKALIRANTEAPVIIGLLYAVLIGFAALAYAALLRFAEARYREIES